MDHQKISAELDTICREVGAFIQQEAAGFERSSVEFKGLNNMVSYVDKKAEEMLVDRLRALVPEAGFITEEGTAGSTGESLHWIIDPLDGTTNFIHGIPTYAVSVALWAGDLGLVGTVYEINRDECFSAWKGGGAWLNGKKISVSETAEIGNSLLATGFPYTEFEQHEQYMRLFSDLMHKCHGLRRIGSAAVDLAYVACGRFDAYFEYNLNPWDVAAGALIVQEAGGQIFNFSGGEEVIRKRELVASNGRLKNELIAIISHYF